MRFKQLILRLALILSGLISTVATAQTPNDSLFQALGGKPGIQKFTAELVQIIVLDPRTKEFFKDADLERLELLLGEQFCALSGGPCEYKGRNMAESHRDLKINNAAFNALAEDLQIAMEKYGVPSRTALKLIALLAPMEREVVTR